jgi:hypothetical protein
VVTDERRAYLDDVATVLWPAPHTALVGVRRPAAAVPGGEFLVLPHRSRPRLLTPVSPRAAAAVVRHHGEGSGRRSRLAAAALALGLRAGAGRLLRRDRVHVVLPADGTATTLAAHLSAVLGRDVVIGLHLGPPRANRKPVVQVLDPAGRTLAYAKIAVDDLTEQLVRTETAALRRIAATTPAGLQVADVLHEGTWQGRPLLVQSALPVWAPRAVLTPDRVVAAAEAVAAVDRVDGVVLTDAPHWRTLVSRLAALPEGDAAGRLRRLLDGLAAAAGGVQLSTGGSHGDFTPWNMACLPDRMLVWDWERFRTDVPVGADLLHHGLQDDVVRGTDPATAARRMVDGAAARLAPLGVAPRAALTTVLVYGADLAVRYLADGQQQAGARLGDVGTWLIPALEGGLRRLDEEER